MAILKIFIVLVTALNLNASQPVADWLNPGGIGPASEATQACLACHEYVTPGIVADWKRGPHSRVTPGEALHKPALERRISTNKLPKELAGFVVGCAECHTANGPSHKDTFEHNGYKVHVVVSPPDCAICHPTETEEYGQNLMSNAYGNLNNNMVYHNLSDTSIGVQSFDGSQTTLAKPDENTRADACFHCHGTKVEVTGMKKRETSMGEMEFPALAGWPSQGVGRINPDGSKGACTSCHPRHQFSIEVARKPYTCSECHKGPDVPAYKAYIVSKHGNIFSSEGAGWDFSAVPWVVGRDFNAPTCAVCHVSLIVNASGEVVAKRTHRMNDRLAYRLFGLIYSHPHPKSADTTIIKNKMGLPLPTELTGEPVAEFVIDAAEQQKRLATLKGVCLACHTTDWVEGHFERLENTIATTNDMTLTATKIMLKAWQTGAAKGLDKGDSIFNEAIEKMWVQQWLFYANSTRFASAMMGADYGVFAEGRWYLAKNIQDMIDWLEGRQKNKKKRKML